MAIITKIAEQRNQPNRRTIFLDGRFAFGVNLNVVAEFRRVLKHGGVIIAFWPTERNASRWLLAPIEWLISRTSGRHFVFFPDEVSRLRSKEQAASYLRGAGLEVLALDFNWRTAFIHRVLVARKVS